MAKIDMTGQKCGRLLVIEEAPKDPNIKSRVIRWRCKCDCGNEVIVAGPNLRNGNTKSCGCLQKEITSNMKRMNLEGAIFGKLTVLYRLELPFNGHTVWHCKCECGNECDIFGTNLVRGLTRSCGCTWHNSFGVQQIAKLLQEFGIPYRAEEKEQINGTNYYWDFIIRPDTPDFWIIEYDGEQHFKSGSESGWNTKENLKKTHQRDTIKNNFAFENNYILIRIPYTRIITMEDLLPETSQFIVNKYNIDDYYKRNGYE